MREVKSECPRRKLRQHFKQEDLRGGSIVDMEMGRRILVATVEEGVAEGKVGSNCRLLIA